MFRQLVLFVALIEVISFAGCHPTPLSQSSMNDIKLRHSNGDSAIVYAENNVVFYRRCTVDTDTPSRTCPTPANIQPQGMALKIYTDKLAAAFGVDADIVRLGTVERFHVLLNETRDLIKSGTLKPDELAKAKDYLGRLEANAERSTSYLNIISKLALGQDLLINQNFSNDFALILSPFANTTVIASDRTFIRDANSGLIWTSITDMCWYDAADVSRGSNLCVSRESYSYGVFALVPEIRRSTILPGCKRTLGLAWALPSNKQLFSTKAGPSGPLRSWTREGKYYTFFYSDASRHTPDEWRDYPHSPGRPREHFVYNYDLRLRDSETYCVAKASDVEPDNDLDGDGVPNRLDKCNRLPNDRTALVDLAGPRIGCAAGQKTDLEMGDTLVEETPAGHGAAQMAPYNPAHAARYIDRATVPVACTSPQGRPGSQVYQGKWDPELLDSNGNQGMWIAPPYSAWTACR